ncbi:hypothetical protein KUTeg_020645 [Tegillarca granosa]|uniref:Uncharacterized protein n=1 Tax=Tegillarca granosa TaxID=220873 RepID=A0ABQ9E8I3_TEGGR|nr:hypothetical protein KUTeg_020645 [Tegillarca granosa]
MILDVAMIYDICYHSNKIYQVDKNKFFMFHFSGSFNIMKSMKLIFHFGTFELKKAFKKGQVTKKFFKLGFTFIIPFNIINLLQIPVLDSMMALLVFLKSKHDKKNNKPQRYTGNKHVEATDYNINNQILNSNSRKDHILFHYKSY